MDKILKALNDEFFLLFLAKRFDCECPRFALSDGIITFSTHFCDEVELLTITIDDIDKYGDYYRELIEDIVGAVIDGLMCHLTKRRRESAEKYIDTIVSKYNIHQ